MDYNIYKEKVFADFKRVKDFFPLLSLAEPPLTSSSFVLYGNLIPFNIYKYTSKDNIEDHSIYINATYPLEFPSKNITAVKDIYSKINWSLVPAKHRHIYTTGNMCTHHPYGEITKVPVEERSIKILFSAYRLFYQYKSFLETGEWIIDDLSHGILANLSLIKEGYSFEDI